jgi:hypothetical protein
MTPPNEEGLRERTQWRRRRRVFSVSLAMQKGCKMTPPNEGLRERA